MLFWNSYLQAEVDHSSLAANSGVCWTGPPPQTASLRRVPWYMLTSQVECVWHWPNRLKLQSFEGLLRLTTAPKGAFCVCKICKGSDKSLLFDELEASSFDMQGWAMSVSFQSNSYILGTQQRKDTDTFNCLVCHAKGPLSHRTMFLIHYSDSF